MKKIILSFILGFILSNFISNLEVFQPFDFYSTQYGPYKFYFQQKVDTPFPMTDHVTEIYYKKINPERHYNNPWKFAGVVYSDPFSLAKTIFSEKDNNILIQFPWNKSALVPK